MKLSTEQLGKLIIGMRKAYSNGENVMAYARDVLSKTTGAENQLIATLIAYDLQAGSYVALSRDNLQERQAWCTQIANLIAPVLPLQGTLLEVGVGEATTLAGVLNALKDKVSNAFGFDISWSRITVAKQWLQEQSQEANLFVGDLMHIPLATNSIDVVYSSHSLEPNGGYEQEAIKECLRVARYAVVLIEPIYELASAEAKARMRHHGYVRGLKETAERLGAEIIKYQLLEHTSNSLNPSGVIILKKENKLKDSSTPKSVWQCPMTSVSLEEMDDVYFASKVGIAYPILRGVPLLSSEYGIIASRLGV